MLLFNFFSIAAFIASVFMAVIGLFLLTLRNRSVSTGHLGIAFLGMSPFHFAYAFTAAYYDPIAAFHRYVTVFFVYIVYIHMTQFALRFPHNRHPRLTRAVFIGQYLISFIVMGLFIIVSLQSDVKYHFDGHYWDFDAEGVSKVVGLLIASFHLLFTGIAVWKVIVVKSRERWPLLAIAASIFITIAIPMVANLMSRDGRLDRGTFQTLFALLTVFGFFAVSIIYINSTKDRSPFMAKIVGITLVTFLVLFQWLSYIFLTEKDMAYDQLYLEYTGGVVEGQIHPEVVYSASIAYPSEKQNSSQFWHLGYNRDQALQKGIVSSKAEAYNSYIYRWLLQRCLPTKISECKEFLLATPSHFSAYRHLLQDYLAGQSQDMSEKEWINKLELYIESLNKKNIVHFNKISQMDAQNFSSLISKYLIGKETPGDSFSVFAQRIRWLISQEKGSNQTIRQSVLDCVRPMQSIDKRRYREKKDQSSQQTYHYIAFQQVDLNQEQIYEVGFSYLDYRKHIHDISLNLTIILVIIVAVVIVIFPLFFQGSLVTPLNNLLAGVTNINAGKLDTYIKPVVQDEIGTLTKTFNLMTRSIRNSKRQLQDYADNLEKKVEERTNKLRKSLEEIQALKLKQDGDYFLTSLLIKPLGINESSSDKVEVDFLVRQKKKFQFRKWDTEIGGDICIANDISLKEKKYIAFINGDAMGKSVQGAGGALVLGVVFRAYVSRTQAIRAEQNRYPEQWLKECFIELQNVFVSFDGSMLISVAMGLVDEETGLMYYLNAEHPWTVLYRDGEAAFIEQELYLHKIGTTGLDGSLSIKTYQLQAGDVVIAGSDGRDDIIVGQDDSGRRIINEDELLFLKRVEEGYGRLEQIEQAILATGELSDDLSLLRLSYMPHAFVSQQNQQSKEAFSQEFWQYFRRGRTKMRHSGQGHDTADFLKDLEQAFTIEKSYPVLLRDLALVYLRNKDYKKAASLCDKYINIRPNDIQFIFFASLAFRKIGHYMQAADLGERIRLRDPKHCSNLIHLAIVYRQLKNLDRAKMMIQKAMDIDPENAKAHRILELLGNS